MSKKTKKEPTNMFDKSGNRVITSQTKDDSSAVFREGFESMVVAVLLALLFRGFEAEAFIIPTGSMAPTLQGMHKDLRCPQCDYRYRTNQHEGTVVETTTCPMCRCESPIDQRANPSFNGDRIIVNKFAYEIGEPERWDVIVFKFPGNAKQNYIKRLVGLPGETLKVRGGDVFAKSKDEDAFTILRKPPAKIPHTLQLVHDSRYEPDRLIKAKWPARWHVPGDNVAAGDWQTSKDRNEYTLGESSELKWLRYRHLPPVNRLTGIASGRRGVDQWKQVSSGEWPTPTVKGRLIRDWYAYNAGESGAFNRRTGMVQRMSKDATGRHWVGDLAVAAAVEITSADGELWLDLVEGGEHYQCQIDVATGVATCAIPDGPELTAQTPVRGKGSHELMWANQDDQVLLWVDGEAMTWSSGGQPHPGHYANRGLVAPEWSAQDPGDLLPAGIGGKNVGLKATRVKIFRDVYYTATYETRDGEAAPAQDYDGAALTEAISTLVFPPSDSAATKSMFDSRRTSIEFTLGEGQYFPMGDNSPQSKDARLWARNGSRIAGAKIVDNCVERDLLIGKAIVVYWPHGWPLGPISLPVVKHPIPNVDRMGKIR